MGRIYPYPVCLSHFPPKLHVYFPYSAYDRTFGERRYFAQNDWSTTNAVNAVQFECISAIIWGLGPMHMKSISIILIQYVGKSSKKSHLLRMKPVPAFMQSSLAKRYYSRRNVSRKWSINTWIIEGLVIVLKMARARFRTKIQPHIDI